MTNIKQLSARCERCNKAITKGKMAQDNYKRYAPYCSYHCQQWHQIELAKQHLATLN